MEFIGGAREDFSGALAVGSRLHVAGGVQAAHNFVESAERFPQVRIHQNPLEMTTSGEHAMEVELVDRGCSGPPSSVSDHSPDLALAAWMDRRGGESPPAHALGAAGICDARIR